MIEIDDKLLLKEIQPVGFCQMYVFFVVLMFFSKTYFYFFLCVALARSCTGGALLISSYST